MPIPSAVDEREQPAAQRRPLFSLSRSTAPSVGPMQGVQLSPNSTPSSGRTGQARPGPEGRLEDPAGEAEPVEDSPMNTSPSTMIRRPGSGHSLRVRGERVARCC